MSSYVHERKEVVFVQRSFSPSSSLSPLCEAVSSIFHVTTLTHILGELSEHSGGRRLHTRTDGLASQECYRGDMSLNGIRWLLMLKESSINL